jgi:hypothetical protein
VTDVYLSIGHGRMPDGRYDPGTIAGTVHEHVQARGVVRLAAAALRRSGVTVEHDDCPDPIAGWQHSPNYAGSAARSRALHPLISVEVHYDWSGAPRGGFGIHDDPAGLALADAIRARYLAAGLPVRSHQNRALYFVRHGHGSLGCVLWECDRVGAGSPASIAEALAAGICDRLGVAYRPPGQTARPPTAALSPTRRRGHPMIDGVCKLEGKPNVYAHRYEPHRHGGKDWDGLRWHVDGKTRDMLVASGGLVQVDRPESFIKRYRLVTYADAVMDATTSALIDAAAIARRVLDELAVALAR